MKRMLNPKPTTVTIIPKLPDKPEGITRLPASSKTAVRNNP
jgi:hypothetical protein